MFRPQGGRELFSFRIHTAGIIHASGIFRQFFIHIRIIHKVHDTFAVLHGLQYLLLDGTDSHEVELGIFLQVEEDTPRSQFTLMDLMW